MRDAVDRERPRPGQRVEGRRRRLLIHADRHSPRVDRRASTTAATAVSHCPAMASESGLFPSGLLVIGSGPFLEGLSSEWVWIKIKAVLMAAALGGDAAISHGAGPTLFRPFVLSEHGRASERIAWFPVVRRAPARRHAPRRLQRVLAQIGVVLLVVEAEQAHGGVLVLLEAALPAGRERDGGQVGALRRLLQVRVVDAGRRGRGEHAHAARPGLVELRGRRAAPAPAAAAAAAPVRRELSESAPR